MFLDLCGFALYIISNVSPFNLFCIDLLRGGGTLFLQNSLTRNANSQLQKQTHAIDINADAEKLRILFTNRSVADSKNGAGDLLTDASEPLNPLLSLAELVHV